MSDIPVGIEPVVVKAKKRPVYPPKWLTKYAGGKKMSPQDALTHVLQKNLSNSDAARELGISPNTLYRNIKRWGVKVER